LPHGVLCLQRVGVPVDDAAMESTDRIFRQTCVKCDRPALTFDQEHRPMCSRHASVFITAKRVVADDDQWWDTILSGKAST
jgi:hypothetical protein